MVQLINIYHSTVKITPVGVKPSTYIESSKEINNKNPKFEIGDIVRISKYKNTVLWAYVISDFKGEEIVQTFYEKELQKTSQKEFRVQKVIQRKGDKLYIKWKGYDRLDCYKGHSINQKIFPESKSLGGKSVFENAAGVDISKFAKNV